MDNVFVLTTAHTTQQGKIIEYCVQNGVQEFAFLSTSCVCGMYMCDVYVVGYLRAYLYRILYLLYRFITLSNKYIFH